MKICLISRYFDQNSGSAEWIYASFLSDSFTLKRIKVYKVYQSNKHSIISLWLRKVFHDWIVIPIKLLRYYILHGCRCFLFLSENQAIYVWLFNLLGASTYTYFHDLMRIKNKKKISRQLLYFNVIYRLAAKSKQIIVNSSTTKDDIINKLGVNPRIIHIIPPIYRQMQVIADGNTKSGRVVGYLGALNKRKRPELLCNLAGMLANGSYQCSDLNIHIWGKGDRLEELKKCATEYSNIKIMGFASEENINLVYSSFDYFIMPSKYEGFGLPIVEALMCGIPCLVMADADIPEEVKSGCIVCQDISDMAKNIHYIEKDLFRYKKLSQNAYNYSLRFNREDCLTSLLKIVGVSEDKFINLNSTQSK